MKIGIYSPYLDTAGGGEKYILTIAEVLSNNESVDIFLDSHLADLKIEEISKNIELLHGINLSKVNFIKAPFGMGSNFFQRLFFLKKYDVLFYLTDGSIFLSTAKKSFIHFQVPFENINNNLWGNFKLKSWNLAIFNSNFTKQLVQKNWPIDGEIIYPPVNTSLFKPSKKINQIVSVGRFFGFLKLKKHSILIQAFKDLVKTSKIKGWSLHLAGGVGIGDENYLEQLKEESKGYDIFLHPNISLDGLKKLYGESKIYWHAAGFGEKDPAKMEHFGISTVEAMVSGCVPVVVNLGGQKEIVENGVGGFLWDTLEQLQEKTMAVIENDKLRGQLAEVAQKKAEKFSQENFKKAILKLVYEHGKS